MNVSTVMDDNILSLNTISKTFVGLKAVSDVSFNVASGSLTALIGPNGAGKTTLFALISGFIKPDSGKVIYKGEDITGHPPFDNASKGLTRTFQIVQPFAGQTVLENVAVGAHLHHSKRSHALEYAQDVIEKMGLQTHTHKQSGELTIAFRKRLELAKALATKPQLILLDEVLAGLNPKDVYDFGAYSYSPFLRANLPSVDIAIYLCSRSILIKCIYDLWSGNCLDFSIFLFKSCTST